MKITSLILALAITVVFTGCRNDQNKKALWEYKVVETACNTPAMEKDLLNENGVVGWELVSCVQTSFAPDGGNASVEKLRSMFYYFKRPLEK